MVERVSATIALGGRLPRSLLEELSRIIESEDLRVDWDGEVFDPNAIPIDAPVRLMAHEVAWGRFTHLERFCRDRGIAYVRWSGGCPGGFGPARVVFTGKGEPENYAVTDDDALIFDLAAIRALGSIAAIEARAADADAMPGPLTIVDDAPVETVEAMHG